MREQTTPPCPAYRSWTWSGVVLSLALTTSLLWYMFWVIMASIELDIKHIVNWYFFASFNLTKVPHTYEGLESVGYWTPLFVFAIFLSSCLVCPCRTYLGKVPPIIYTAVVLQNILLFIYMLLAGRKIIAFFLIVFPLQLVYQLHAAWWFLLLAPTLVILFSYVIPCDVSRQKPAKEPPSPSYLMCPRPAFFIFLLALSLHLVLPVAMQRAAQIGCLPCGTSLPKKPGLIAHRGCGYLYPENTLLSFLHSSQIPGMVGLETDVQISYDGVPFLLHDPHTIRTTDVVSRCPEVDPLANATWLNFTSGVCPLNKLNVGSWFSKELNDHKADVQKLPEFDNELLPSLEQFLSVAKDKKMIAIFDVREPNVAHPYHQHYLNKSLKAILKSRIQQSKVWWLTPQRRDWVLSRHPKLVQVTKTEDTPFEKFREEKIKVVNDDWSTPLEIVRQYQAANLTINMYFVDSSFAFNYAWCVGVHSVTTNNCKQLASLAENRLHQVCRSLQHSVKHQLWPLAITFLLCSVSCMTCFECIQRMKRNQNSAIHKPS